MCIVLWETEREGGVRGAGSGWGEWWGAGEIQDVQAGLWRP